MARGGINRALVEKARAALLARGQHPSIDAVRVELGNTGSKSTIHRYLRELEEAEVSRLDDAALLSKPIKDLIGRLATRLQEEAQTTVDQASDRHAAAIADWEVRYAQQAKTLEVAQQELVARQVELESVRADNQALRNRCEAQAQEIHAAQQSAREFEIRVEELRQQIASLEEKHTHSREALEHYRQSAKDQREQTTRQHEHQVQQLQAEIRQLNQTLSIKQSEILTLNQDNARLVSERGVAQRATAKIEDALRKAEERYLNAETVQQSAIKDRDNLRDEIKALTSRYRSATKARDTLSNEQQVLARKVVRLETELAVKNELIEQLTDVRKTSKRPADRGKLS